MTGIKGDFEKIWGFLVEEAGLLSAPPPADQIADNRLIAIIKPGGEFISLQVL